MTKFVTGALVCAALCIGVGVGVSATSVLAGDNEAKGSEAAKEGEAPQADLSAPGEVHKALEQSVGNFEFTGKFWLEPGSEPKKSKGTAKREMILGGRFLHETITTTECEISKEFGKPLPAYGQAYVGFNNFTNKVEHVWLSDCCTQMSFATGTIDEKTGVCTLNGSMVCPMTKETLTTRTTHENKDENTELLTMYTTAPGKDEVKVFEITFTRKK